jgi:hypothetical protein
VVDALAALSTAPSEDWQGCSGRHLPSQGEEQVLIHGKYYAEVLQRALASASEASVAIAFWGAGAAASLFKGWDGRPLRILCNLAHGGTNPDAIRELQKLTGAEVRQLSNLHAKVVVTDTQVIVGSANASANGLGFEGGELTGWRELGVVSREEHVRADAAAWFAEQWQAAQDITTADLLVASVRWKARRRVRIQPAAAGTLLEQTSESQLDGRYYLVVYREGLSHRALESLKEHQATLGEIAGSGKPSKLDLYESWEDERSAVLFDGDAILLPVYYGSHGKIKVGDAQKPLPDLVETYKNNNLKTVYLDFNAIVQDEAIVRFIAARESKDTWVEQLRPWLEHHRDEGTVAQTAPLSDFLAWREANRRKGH